MRCILVALMLFTAFPCYSESWKTVPRYEQWQHAMSELKGNITHISRHISNFEAKLQHINADINSYPFYESSLTYMVPFYVEKPSEFRKWGGSCKDYAVAKYYRIHNELGVADTDMKIAVVNVNKTGEQHAILIVKHENKTYVVDNYLSKKVENEEFLTNFTIYYTLNRAGWEDYTKHIQIAKNN